MDYWHMHLKNQLMFDFGSVGLQVIVAWFGTFLVNVILAQAAFQMALSSETPEEGQKGMILAGFMAVPFIVCGVLFGIAAAIVIPDAQAGLIAIPQYLMEVLPAPSSRFVLFRSMGMCTWLGGSLPIFRCN